ncbi:MAG TPA: ATP-binding cassette domain-containing protein [Streptosporangiaceae bacterium]|jgi:ABC-2 type transport system ATP-binding protein
MSDELAVEATGLKKSYGTTRVLAGVDLRVPRGSVFALLGPNGAGKTTMVRILATLLRADAGEARVAGFDVVRQRRQVRTSISLTGQFAAVDELQTGAENLRMMARLARMPHRQARQRASELLSQFDLVQAAGKRVATYSGGMRRRLDLAAGLVLSPAVIFLDEPTTGLDPRSRQQMWEVINGLAGRGVTIFLTTQYLEEADQVADKIALVDDGRVVAEGTAAQLKQRVAGQRLDLVARTAADFATLARRLGDRAIRADVADLVVGVATDGSATQVRDLLDELDPDRSAVATFAVHTPTLDDVFLALTGSAAGAAQSSRPDRTGKEKAHA